MLVRTIFILTFFFSFGNQAISQDWLEDTCELKGPVKSYEHRSVEYYGKDKEWSELSYEFNKNGYVTWYNNSSSFFGKNANSTSRIFDGTGTMCYEERQLQGGDTTTLYLFEYSLAGKAESKKLYLWGKLYNTWYYSYDEQGNMVEYNIEFVRKSTHKSQNYFEYDDYGRKVLDVHKSPTWVKHYIWKYDDHGNLLEEKYLDSNRASKTTYEMDDDGNVVNEVTEDYSNNANTEKSYMMTYEYNEKNQAIKETKSLIDGTVVYACSRKFNKKGDPVYESYHYPKDDKTYLFEFKYKYDSYGNWINKKRSREKELLVVETRKIEYFKDSQK